MVGLDLGTTGAKAGVIDGSGGILATEVATYETATPHPTLNLKTTGTPRGSILATRTSTPTATPTAGPTESPFTYTAEVLYQRAQLYGTNWSGIAGLIFGLDLKHQPGIGVKAWGDAPLGPEGQLLPSGTAPQYGPSGFEFTLGDKPISGKYNVQLLGATGTGKTYLAVAMAVAMLKTGQIKRIILVRPAVEAGEKLGFLPGDMVRKSKPLSQTFI
jgi:hypothetical protein